MPTRNNIESQLEAAIEKNDRDAIEAVCQAARTNPSDNGNLCAVVASILSKHDLHEDAVAMMDAGLEKCDKIHHGFIFIRGLYYYRLNNVKSAIKDYSALIDILSATDGYYNDAALVFRAECYLKLGEYELAKHDCLRVMDRDKKMWTHRLISAVELIKECDSSNRQAKRS
jgi:tetratricopeptide (TPR) repeat protein